MGDNSQPGLESLEADATLLRQGGEKDGPTVYFVRPSFGARSVNRLYGWITRIGFGLPNSYLLQVSGRKTGKTRSVAVNVLSYNDKIFLVSTRGHTQWSRNALANRNVILKRGTVRAEFRLRVVLDAEKPKILKAYVTRFRWMAGRFFPVSAGSPSGAFAPIADRYPVFELIRK
jgi:deazaflavin-dependent oxidoreductase (nitroreductase family)